MSNEVLLAQSSGAGAPPVLPMMPPGGLPDHVQRPPQPIVDTMPPKVDPNSSWGPPYLVQHDQACLISPFWKSKETVELFDRCGHYTSNSKMLSPEFPECSCEVYHSTFPDFFVIFGKTPVNDFSFYATGLGIYVVVGVLLLFGAILWSPIGYAISAHRIKKKMNDLGQHHIFMIWYEKVWTRNLSLLMIFAGILMAAAGVTGNVEITLPGGYQVSTAVPGVAFCIIAVFLWLRSSRATARGPD